MRRPRLRLARELVAAGHAVRGTTRDPARAEAIRAAGAEPVVADPDRIGTLMEAIWPASPWCAVLLGTAAGDPEQVAALHDGRLRMLWEKLVDTPVRGVVYEAAGTVPADVLAHGRGGRRAGARHLAHPAGGPRGRSGPIASAGWRTPPATRRAAPAGAVVAYANYPQRQ